MNNIRDTSNTSQPRDNSKTARRYLDMTGIQSVLNIRVGSLAAAACHGLELPL
ncbi:hypothetical protein [Escherichia coli]|uniref:hypothetical protein n=1 Tax=Escherichia coli TaxID=562 RepID=UPI001F2848E8|nr:hypothetical protein [Escherichia coli]